MACQLSSEAVKIIIQLKLEEFSSKLFRAYLPSLPVTGREGAGDLATYCIVTGHLFRGWILHTKGKEGYYRLMDIIDDAIQKREARLESLKPSARRQVEDVVKRENRILKILASKLERDSRLFEE